jgi:hypothetical protein
VVLVAGVVAQITRERAATEEMADYMAAEEGAVGPQLIQWVIAALEELVEMVFA